MLRDESLICAGGSHEVYLFCCLLWEKRQSFLSSWHLNIYNPVCSVPAICFPETDGKISLWRGMSSCGSCDKRKRRYALFWNTAVISWAVKYQTWRFQYFSITRLIFIEIHLICVCLTQCLPGYHGQYHNYLSVGHYSSILKERQYN